MGEGEGKHGSLVGMRKCSGEPRLFLGWLSLGVDLLYLQAPVFCTSFSPVMIALVVFGIGEQLGLST